MDNVKIVVYVPTTHADKVREAIGKTGGGIIGNYDNCTFSAKGIGRFRPKEGAKPFIGRIGEVEEVEEEKIEFVCAKKKAKEVVRHMVEVHPYEEVAYDIYPLFSKEEL